MQPVDGAGLVNNSNPLHPLVEALQEDTLCLIEPR